MKIKVIGAGVGRTGTASLQMALQILGFKSYHMREVFQHPEHLDLWIKKLEGEKVGWQDIFNEYDACVDYPACAFYKELLESYPDAKVILTVRDPNSWYLSCINTIYEATNGWAAKALALVSPFTRKFNRFVNKLAWESYYEGKFAKDASYSKDKFIQWNEEVKKVVPKEKLLVFEVKQGWEPLCNFLGVPIPSQPFPHVNDTAEFQSHIKGMKIAVVVGGSLIAGAAAVAVKLFMKYRLKY